MSKRILMLLIFFVSLSGCASYITNAPVRDINTRREGNVLYYHVQPSETLYSIAWRYDRDYRELAKLNGLSAPYAIFPGENIRLSGPVKKLPRHISKPIPKTISYKPVTKKGKKVARKRIVIPREPAGRVNRWIWPVRGKVLKGFSRENKGIDISGKLNGPVKSTASGKVVYAGHGIRGYGNLLIIKHNSLFLTAYAHNDRLLVKEGQWVKAGQVVARMGKTSSGRVELHFEIRRAGAPVNPLRYLR